MPDPFGEISPSRGGGRSRIADSIPGPGPAAEVMLMLLADARLPTGAHTQSAGLEPALRGGMPPAEVPRYIRARLRTVTAVEAGAAVLARFRAVEAMNGGAEAAALPVGASAGEPAAVGSAGMGTINGAASMARAPARARSAEISAVDGAVEGPAPALARALTEVDRAWRARTVSPELRETSVLLARGYARLVRRLWPDDIATQALSMMNRPGRAVVLGVTAALAGLSAAQLVRLIGYDDAQTIAAATLKLEPLDPAVTTGWVMAAAPEIERLANELSTIDTLDQIPAFGAPLIERWAQVHATTSQRLFRA